MHKKNVKLGGVVDTKSSGTHAPRVPPASQKGGDGETAETSCSGDSAARDSTFRRPDPTRYGDWERNGRCIDF